MKYEIEIHTTNSNAVIPCYGFCSGRKCIPLAGYAYILCNNENISVTLVLTVPIHVGLYTLPNAIRLSTI